MRSLLLATACVCIAALALCAGCRTGMARWEPIKRVVRMPEVFEDGRIKTNPWREVPEGPEYPYELIYHKSTNTFRVVARSEAPQISYRKITTWQRDAGPFTMIVSVRRPDKPEIK